MSSKPFWIAAGLAALLVTASVWYTLAPEPAPLQKPRPQQAPVGQFGPGDVPATAHLPDAALAFTYTDSLPPGGLELKSDGHLVISRALRNVLDYFLLGGHTGTRQQHLQDLLAHLRLALPPIAFAEARQITLNYVVYLDEHDKLLGRLGSVQLHYQDKASPVELDRIDAWIAARSRLRESILGIDVARSWFAEEEAAERRTVSALREPAGNVSVKTESVHHSDPLQQSIKDLRDLTAAGMPALIQRERIARQFGELAAQRFEAIESDESAWQQRYADYRREVGRITAHAGIAEIDRIRQIDLLRAQAFPAEPERLRAQALDAVTTDSQ